jgi:hypothetical protein
MVGIGRADDRGNDRAGLPPIVAKTLPTCWVHQGCHQWGQGGVHSFLPCNLSQNGVNRSSAKSAFCPNAPDCRVDAVRWLYRHRNVLFFRLLLLCGSFLLVLLVLGQHQSN